MQVKSTKDYSQFKLIKGNREINQRHLATLTLSIMQKNMLEFAPIIVNDEFEIVDGQHRFEVAKNNNLTVYYIVAPNASISDVVNMYMKRKMGFATFTKDKLENLARAGGKAAHRMGVAHEWTSEEAKAAGRKGGKNRWKNKQVPIEDSTIIKTEI